MNKNKPTKNKKNTYQKDEPEINNIVNEDLQAYGFSDNSNFSNSFLKSDSNSLLGIKKKPEFQMSYSEKIEQVEKGIKKNDLMKLKSKTALDFNTLAELLSISRSTLINKPDAETFNSSVSEKILTLAEIYSFGYTVFESSDRFNQWMQSPNKALGGKSPIDICDTHFGKEEIKNLIGRLEYGVYS